MEFRIGTSGYSYKEWKGAFYPERLPAKGMLEFYATQLGAVEINNTFYRLPKPELLGGWRRQVPEGFRFAIKAPQRMTHVKKLASVQDELAALLRAVKELDAGLGVLLFQLPPWLRADVSRLQEFAAQLPVRAAFEFRHASWSTPEVRDALRQHNIACVITDADESSECPELESTADFGYVRLRRTHYAPQALQAWKDRLRAQPWREVFVFFKHEDSAQGALWARDFGGL